MRKKTVVGSISQEIFIDRIPSQQINDRFLRAFRDYLEDRLEHEFEVTAHIELTDSGELSLAFDKTPKSDEDGVAAPGEAQLLEFAEKCLADFRLQA
jgi:hypothetical protein